VREFDLGELIVTADYVRYVVVSPMAVGARAAQPKRKLRSWRRARIAWECSRRGCLEGWSEWRTRLLMRGRTPSRRWGAHSSRCRILLVGGVDESWEDHGPTSTPS
jgi:hypothetical protein